MILSGVYRIVNKENKKSYIGGTSNFKKREYIHFWKLAKGVHDNQHLQNAYDKYGKNSFYFEVLAICPKEYFLRLEQWFIDNLSPEYNLSPFAITSKNRAQKIYKFNIFGELVGQYESMSEAIKINGSVQKSIKKKQEFRGHYFSKTSSIDLKKFRRYEDRSLILSKKIYLFRSSDKKRVAVFNSARELEAAGIFNIKRHCILYHASRNNLVGNHFLSFESKADNLNDIPKGINKRSEIFLFENKYESCIELADRLNEILEDSVSKTTVSSWSRRENANKVFIYRATGGSDCLYFYKQFLLTDRLGLDLSQRKRLTRATLSGNLINGYKISKVPLRDFLKIC